jgi:hypothetical protein
MTCVITGKPDTWTAGAVVLPVAASNAAAAQDSYVHMDAQVSGVGRGS